MVKRETAIPLAVGLLLTVGVFVVGGLAGWSKGAVGSGFIIAMAIMSALGALMADIGPTKR